MKLTGHKTESVYRRYAIVAETDLREGVVKLARLGTGAFNRPVGHGAHFGHTRPECVVQFRDAEGS